MTAAQESGWRASFQTAWRVLIFRVSQRELVELNWRHLAIGLVSTWVVGIGRYWDNPRVGLMQHLGVGSVIYVILLALFLWLVIWPLRPRHWSYFRVLTFITLVSPPAILYAIPVQMFFSFETADAINSWFLVIVATWRVALLFFFLRRLGELGWQFIIVASLLPLTIVVNVLVFLNLDKAVFSIMGGRSQPTPDDSAFAALFVLAYLSLMLFIPLLVIYVCMVIYAGWEPRKDSHSKDGDNGRQ